MTITDLHEAKTQLSRRLEPALAGEEVIISQAGPPLGKLSPYEQTTQPRRPGSWRGQVTSAEDFDEMRPEFLQAFQKDDIE